MYIYKIISYIPGVGRKLLTSSISKRKTAKSILGTWNQFSRKYSPRYNEFTEFAV